MSAIKRRPLVAVVVLAFFVWGPLAVAANHKLFMKDGTYQVVSSYEINGDRVRFYSVERSEWEEVPLEMVDLDATKRAQDEDKAVQKKQLEEGHEIELQRFYRPPENGYEIAPGVHLPQEEGAYAYDGRRVIRLIQSPAELVTDKRRAALALAVPAHLLKSRSAVVLSGPKAAVRLQQAEPTFYVQSSSGLGPKIELFPVKVVKETRVVEKVELSRSGVGKATGAQAAIQLERKQLAPGLYSLTPLHPLDPGEYVLGDLNEQAPNLQLWDFGLFETPSKPGARKPPPRDTEQE